MSAAAGGKLRVEVTEFKPHRSNTLFGFVTITIPALHLRVNDATVHEKNGKRWVCLPGKVQIDCDGNTRRDEHTGKPLYTPTIEFTDKATRDAFSSRVVESLLEFSPDAFEPEDV